MKIEVFAHHKDTIKSLQGKAELFATRRKHKTFDVFKIHGTDQNGVPFNINFYIDPGQQFKMDTVFTSDHPDNPNNTFSAADD